MYWPTTMGFITPIRTVFLVVAVVAHWNTLAVLTGIAYVRTLAVSGCGIYYNRLNLRNAVLRRHW